MTPKCHGSVCLPHRFHLYFTLCMHCFDAMPRQTVPTHHIAVWLSGVNEADILETVSLMTLP